MDHVELGASPHCSGVILKLDKLTRSCDLMMCGGVPEGIVTIDDYLRVSWSGVPVLKVVAKS